MESTKKQKKNKLFSIEKFTKAKQECDNPVYK